MPEATLWDRLSRRVKNHPIGVILLALAIVLPIIGQMTGLVDKISEYFKTADLHIVSEALPVAGQTAKTWSFNGERVDIFPEGAVVRVTTTHNLQQQDPVTIDRISADVRFEAGKKLDLGDTGVEVSPKARGTPNTFIVTLDRDKAQAWWRPGEGRPIRSRPDNLLEVTDNPLDFTLLPDKEPDGFRFEIQAETSGFYIISFTFSYIVGGKRHAQQTKPTRIYYEGMD